MKTSNYLIALAALTSFTLVGCSDNDFLGTGTGPEAAQQGNGEITFSTGDVKMTRAGDGEITGLDAANRLNRQFIVWGDKHATAEQDDADDDVSVFTNYVVKYLDNSAYTTESNTHGWEYVGYEPYSSPKVTPAVGNIIQSIKYWDYDAAGGYTFHGISALPTDIEAGNVAVAKTQAGSAVYDKGWVVTVNDKASLADLYAADRKPVAKSNNGDDTKVDDYGGYVKLTFRSLVSKVRFAMYETVPGYSVNIDRFYVEAPTKDGDKAWDAIGSTTNFQIATAKKYAPVKEGSTLTIKYETNEEGNENRVKVANQVEPSTTDATTFKYAVFGTNLNSADRIGETSPTATYDYADKAYTYVLPQEVGDMTLYVTYTLTSLDGSGDKIVVKGATAKIPASYNMWKNNFAYTYIFKISDNTNGNPGTIGEDPVGLYPITFDACVADESSDFQETITTVDEPSITTYANGKIVTENDEYVTGKKVYITVADATNYAVTITKNTGTGDGNSRLFEVLNLGTENITEETVANYANNYMILKEVTASTTVVEKVPMSDGNDKAISALEFTPSAKVYAYQYKNGTDLYWKIIKIADGNPVSISATPVVTNSPIVLTNGTATITLKEGDNAILGAAPKMTIHDGILKYADNGNGTYTVSLVDKGIKAGTNISGTATNYPVAYNGGTTANVGVNLPYKFDVGGVEITSSAKLALNQGQTKTVNLKVGTVAIGEGVISDGSGITVTETSTAGAYEIAAASNATAGDHTVTIAGQTLYITVTAYNFGAAKYIYTVDKSGASATISEAAKYIDLKQNNGTETPADIAVGSITKATGLTMDKKGDAADDKGLYKPTSTTGGVYDISYQGASATVTINEYDLNVASGNSATFNHETGSTKLTLTLNGGEIIPVSGNFKIYNGETDVTSKFTISIVGKNITIAPKSGQIAASTSLVAKYAVMNAAATPASTVVAKIALTAE